MLTPLVFMLLFASVQFAMYFFARHVAIAAAQEGARVARAEAANNANWPVDATAKATAWIDQLAPNLLRGPSLVQTSSSPPGGDWTVTVTVTATVPSLIPGMAMSVTETSTGPVERFIPDPG
jgi:hypothetical protein